MSSPPPPHQTPPNALKRPSISSSASQPVGSNKRPRMHPLRQTSFPNTIDNESRAFSTASDAGSVTGSFTGSLGGMSADGVFGGARGKKRGRKSKAEKEREREDVASAKGLDHTRLGSVDADGSSVRGGAAGGAGADEGDEDEDFDDEGEFLGGEEGTTDTEAEKKNLAILVDAFNPIQSERYDLFKRAKLRKETLRRIVNHALSQSVPASVVTTINGFTKVYAGEIIEKARTVQLEWAEAHDRAARAAFEAEEAALEAKAKAAAEAAEAARNTSASASAPPTPSGETVVKKEASEGERATSSSIPPHMLPAPPSSDPPTHRSVYSPSPTMTAPSSQTPGLNQSQSQSQSTPRPKREFKPPPNPHRGQLLPSHLREALRRYKRDCEGGGVGFSGLSMGNLGVKGAYTWNSGSVGGRRLFR